MDAIFTCLYRSFRKNKEIKPFLLMLLHIVHIIRLEPGECQNVYFNLQRMKQNVSLLSVGTHC